MDTEIWKDVIGYEGYYEVSNLGRVRSVTRKVPNRNSTITCRGQIIRTSKKDGYLRLSLAKERKRKTYYVHTLVAYAFIGNPPGPTGSKGNDYTVDHLDENILNNKANNLEWVTRIENGNRYRANAGHYATLNTDQITDNDIEAVKAVFKTGRFTEAQIAKMLRIKIEDLKNILDS